MKILILAANPRMDLNLDDEVRLVRRVIERSSDRNQFEIVSEPGVRIEDLQYLLLRHKPQIVHFCGHGSGEEGLVLKTEDGGEKWVKADALAGTFKLNPVNSQVRCVILNACYSEVQANAIVENIDYVVGMRHEVPDGVAIAFAKGFYVGLGEGCSVEDAFECGKNAIQLEITGSSKVRSGVSEQQRKAEVVNAVANTVIPEHLKPILKIRAGLLASQPPEVSQATREEIQLEVDRALAEEEPTLKQFREQVQEYLSDHKLEDYEKVFLEQLRKELGISIPEAKKILDEEQAPILQAQEAYTNRLKALIDSGLYPFTDAINQSLRTFQAQRGLTDAEVEEISRPILNDAEGTLQQKTQQAYEANLRRYEQEFRKAIEAQYPLDSYVRDGLNGFWESLRLRLDDVEQIEQSIIALKESAYQEEQERQRIQERQRAEKQKQEAAKYTPPLQVFEFQTPKVTISTQTIEKPGFFGKKTETVKTVNVSYQSGRAELFSEDLGNGVTLEMISILGGTFMMGQTEDEKQQLIQDLGEENYQKYCVRELPRHQVMVQPFFMGKFAVTQAQWRVVAALPKVNTDLDPEPSCFKGDRRPVEKVSWHEAVEFCDRLSQLTMLQQMYHNRKYRHAESGDRLSRKAGRQYRLPSEAEWEYACRAGTTTPFYCGETISTDLANYDGNYTYGSGVKGVYRKQTTDVGSFPPNPFGLYDMHGNVREWCSDSKHSNYDGAPTDGRSWNADSESDSRLTRGGSWVNYPRYCRSAFRIYFGSGGRYDALGFRVVCVLV